MIVEKAYAKINLTLKVISKRLDGYHELESIMLPLELHDVLTFEKEVDNQLYLYEKTPIENNIILKTARLIQEKYRVNQGAKISLLKHIPVSAGLAGGSADCAATIRGLDRLWDLNLTDQDMFELAKSLGSDTMFCLYNRPALVTGRGENIMFIDLHQHYHVLLVNPGFGISTQEVFSKHANFSSPSPDHSEIISAFNHKDLTTLSQYISNDLCQVTYALRPALTSLLDSLKNHTSLAMMSGSGPTHFAFFTTRSALHHAVNNLPIEYLRIETCVKTR